MIPFRGNNKPLHILTKKRKKKSDLSKNRNNSRLGRFLIFRYKNGIDRSIDANGKQYIYLMSF